MKYIIDTDIGDDIDDAFSLLLAMELDFDIIGITTVFRNTSERARIAKRMLKLYGGKYASVPVFAGHGDPIGEPKYSHDRLFQYTPELEGELYAPNSESPEDAVDFIVDSCKKYGNDLTIIAIGAFTNIARALLKDEAAVNSAAEVIVMGGCFFRQYTNWNVVCDVEAAKIMFDATDKLTCLGSDVTYQVPLGRENQEIILGEHPDALRNYIAQLYRLNLKSGLGNGCLHDPLTVYYAYDKSICRFEKGPVEVITEGLARGLTLNVRAYSHTEQNPAYENHGLSKSVLMGREVDAERMRDAFMKCYGR